MQNILPKYKFILIRSILISIINNSFTCKPEVKRVKKLQISDNPVDFPCRLTFFNIRPEELLVYFIFGNNSTVF
ncbi:MAG: hypothetical protein EA408_04975 [Marinilabiliales bacterium]|nr:MAG: hypothetical protein EA408_04975 [Marinilabiliales bacterium]